VPPLPRYTVRELEYIATSVLRQRFPEGVTIPVDVDYIVETEPNVTLDIVSGLQARCGVAGAVVSHPEERRFTIVIDEQVADGNAAFYRFTVAEEYSHLILHRGILGQVRDLGDVVELHGLESYYDVLDRNAKRLASCLLMPTELLRQDARSRFAALRAAGGVGEEELMQKITRQLAQRYHVSVTAMRIRLNNWPLSIATAVRDALRVGLNQLPE
jgi:hypothetical protein